MRARAALGCLILGACSHVPYEARPVDLAKFPAELDARRLDPRPVNAAWSGADLLAAALQRNPAVAEAAARYRTAVAAARTARVAPAPSITLTAEYANDAAASSPWLFGGVTDIPLNIGGRKTARYAAADIAVLQALYDYGEAVWAVRTALAKAEVELALADEETALAERVTAVRQDRFERIQRRVAAGEDARPAALVAQTDLAASRRRITDAQGRRDQARVTIARSLGMSPAQLPALSLAPLNLAPDPMSLSAWRIEAALQRRDVLKAVADYDLAEAALRLEIAKQYPEVRIGPGYTWERGLTKLPFNLTLALPPLDMNRAAIAQAEARRTDAGRALESVQASTLAAVDQAAAALAAARAQAARTQNQDLAVAARTAALTRNLVNGGELDRTDELAAEAARLDVELALLDLRRVTALAGVDLEDALRRAFDPAQTALLQDAVKTLGAAG